MKKTILKRISAVLLTLCMLCMTLIASASQVLAAPETGSIKIVVKPDFEGIPLYLIEIGSYENGTIVINDTYAPANIGIESATTTDEYIEAANIASAFTKANGITGTISWLDVDGEANFTDLPLNKTYLVMQPMGEEVVQIQPMILTVPLATDNGLDYDISIVPKYVDNRDKDFQGAVILTKVGYDNIRLPGATFSFWQKIYYTDPSKLRDGLELGEDETGTYYWKRFKKALTSDKNGQIVVEELPFATFRFIETEAPAGYMLDPTPHEFTVTHHGTLKIENEKYVKDIGEIIELTVTNDIATESSKPGPSTPEPGNPEPSEYSGASQYPGGSVSSTSYEPDKPGFELTGDDIIKYCIIGFAVCVSLAVIILLVVLGNRKKKDKNQ